MTTRLGEMLIEAGRLTPAQLEEALKSRDIFGGRLGTNLIELGYIEEDELAAFLGKKTGVPCVKSEELMSVPPEIIELIPRELAENYRIIPLGLERKRLKKLNIAMIDPSDLPLIDEISFVTGYFIMPMIAPELRMVLALEKHYGIKPDTRFVQYAEKIWARQKPTNAAEKTDMEAVPPVIPKEAEEETQPLTEEIAASLEPVMSGDAGTEPSSPEPLESLPEEAPPFILEPVAVEQARAETEEPPSLNIAPLETEPVQEEAPTLPGEQVWEEIAEQAPEQGEEPVISLDSLAESLTEAKDRECIAELLVSYLGMEFDRAALFMIKGNIAAGWKAVREGEAVTGLDMLHISLELPSALKFVVDGKRYYLGSIPETPGNIGFLDGIGGDAPAAALLVPLMLMGRVVAIVYVDGGKAPLASRLAELQKLVGKASMAFEILILKNKILMT